MACCIFCKSRDVPTPELNSHAQPINNNETTVLLGNDTYQARPRTSKTISLFVVDSNHQLTCCEQATYGCLRGTTELRNYAVSANKDIRSLVAMGVGALVSGSLACAKSMSLLSNSLGSSNCGTCCAAFSVCSSATLASAVIGACAVGGTISLVALIYKLSKLSKAQAQSVIKHLVEHVNKHGAMQNKESAVTTQPTTSDGEKDKQIQLLNRCSEAIGADNIKEAVEILQELQQDTRFPMTITQKKVDKGTEFMASTQL